MFEYKHKQFIIETNDIKFFECETALSYLHKQRWIDKEGDMFILNEVGKKRADGLKFL